MDLCRLAVFLLFPCLANLQLLCDLEGAGSCPLHERTPSRDKLCQHLRDYVTCVEHHIAGCKENESHSFTEAIEHLKSGYQGKSFNCQFDIPGGHLFLQGPQNDAVGFINSTVQIYCNVMRRVDDHDSTNTGVFTMYWQFKPWNSSSFTNIVTVTGLYYYSWDVASADWSKYNITQGKQLLIQNVDFSDAGIYRCGLRETKEKAQAELFVLGNAKCVNERPVIELLNASHPPNALYSCDVNYAGGSAPNLTWYYREDQLIEMEETVSNVLASSLLSFPVSPIDRGKNYRCHISYQTANWVHICQPSPPLNIKFPVQVTSLVVKPYMKSNFFHKGEKITLYCGATGDPAPHFEWKFKAVNSTGFRFLSYFHHHLITELGEKTAGAYQCVVYNKIDGHSFQDAKVVDIKLSDSEKADRHVMPVPDSSRTIKKTTLSPYAIGAMVSAALAVILIFVFIFLAVKLKDPTVVLGHIFI